MSPTTRTPGIPKPAIPRNYGTTSITVDVDIDIAEAVAELSDADLREECKRRGIPTDEKSAYAAAQIANDWETFTDDIRRAFRDGDRLHLEVLLMRMGVVAGIDRAATPGLAKT